MAVVDVLTKMTESKFSRTTLFAIPSLARAWLRQRGLFGVLAWGFGIVGGAGSLLFLVNLFLKNKWLSDFQQNASSNVLSVFALVIAAISSLYNRQERFLNDIKDDLDTTKSDLRSVVAKMDLRIRSGSVFAHCAVVGDDTRLIDEFSVRKHDRSAYLSMHSEVLYYSALCSLLDHWKGDIKNIWRALAFFPDTPTSMFLPELLDILADLPTQCRVYLFRNDVLDYDRPAMQDQRQQHLWPTFVKASRILFRDHGAQYGFLEPKSHSQSIWYGRREFRTEFGVSYERLLIELKSGKAIACIVERDPGTFRFRSARFVSGHADEKDVAETKKYFDELTRDGRWKWYNGDPWYDHGLEVAIVSGEEMEIHAGENVTLWAVDDFPTQPVPGDHSRSLVQNPANSWQAPGSSRDIAWRKTVVAALKGSTVNRVFLVDSIIFDSDADLISLFVTMAVQYRFLHQDSISGAVRLLVKKEGHKKTPADQFYPDLAIMVHGTQDVLGGVIVHPEPEYVKPGSDSAGYWLTHVNRMWGEAQSNGEFPLCFLPGREILANHEMEIIDRIADREDGDLDAGTDKEEYKRLVGNWFGAQVKLLGDQKRVNPL